MSYDSSKDTILWQKELAPDGKTGIEFSACSYDGGPPKIKLQRFGTKKSGEKYYVAKLQRLSIREMQQIVDAFAAFEARGTARLATVKHTS